MREGCGLILCSFIFFEKLMQLVCASRIGVEVICWLVPSSDNNTSSFLAISLPFDNNISLYFYATNRFGICEMWEEK